MECILIYGELGLFCFGVNVNLVASCSSKNVGGVLLLDLIVVVREDGLIYALYVRQQKKRQAIFVTRNHGLV